MTHHLKTILLAMILLAVGCATYGDVETTTCTVTHSCNGSATAFTFSFPIIATSDLVIILRTVSTGAEDVLSETTDYSVSATNNDFSNGGTVTTVQTYSSSYKLTILRNVPDTQLLTLSDTGLLRLAALEKAYDKLTMLVQQLQEELSRSFKIPRTESTTTEVDDSVNRADKNLTFDSSGNATVTTLLNTGTANISAFGETLIDDADIATAQDTLGLPGGLVRMVRTGVGTFKVFSEDGTEVDISASTTDGLQEAITEASDNGWDLHVSGGGYNASGLLDPPLITCIVQVEIPQGYLRRIVMDGVNIKFTNNLGTDTGLRVNSSMMCSLEINGRIEYEGRGYAVQFSPTTSLNKNAQTIMTDSYFSIDTIAYTSGGQESYASCVGIGSSAGSTANCVFRFGELDGAGDDASPNAKYGILIATPPSGKTISNNLFYVTRIYDVFTVGVQVGRSTTANTRVYGNHFLIGNIDPKGATANAIGTYASNNYYNFASNSSVSGTYDYGIYLESSASNNIFIARHIDDEDTADYYRDASSSGNYIQIGSVVVSDALDFTSSVIAGASPFVFEGATSDAYETTLAITEPTADRTLTMPNRTGNFVVADDTLDIRVATVDLTATQIKALATTQITLVAAPGANKVLKLISCLLILDNGSTNYDDASGDGNLYIKYVDGSGLAATGSIEGDGFIDCTADTMISVQPAALAATAASAMSNKALVLDNDGAEFTTGDGTLTVIIHYGVYSDGL